eukprot:1230208-Prymnesium_polylepis.1
MMLLRRPSRVSLRELRAPCRCAPRAERAKIYSGPGRWPPSTFSDQDMVQTAVSGQCGRTARRPQWQGLEGPAWARARSGAGRTSGGLGGGGGAVGA